jgi:hypothetical protein
VQENISLPQLKRVVAPQQQDLIVLSGSSRSAGSSKQSFLKKHRPWAIVIIAAAVAVTVMVAATMLLCFRRQAWASGGKAPAATPNTPTSRELDRPSDGGYKASAAYHDAGAPYHVIDHYGLPPGMADANCGLYSGPAAPGSESIHNALSRHERPEAAPWPQLSSKPMLQASEINDTKAPDSSTAGASQQQAQVFNDTLDVQSKQDTTGSGQMARPQAASPVASVLVHGGDTCIVPPSPPSSGEEGIIPSLPGGRGHYMFLPPCPHPPSSSAAMPAVFGVTELMAPTVAFRAGSARRRSPDVRRHLNNVFDKTLAVEVDTAELSHERVVEMLGKVHRAGDKIDVMCVLCKVNHQCALVPFHFYFQSVQH